MRIDKYLASRYGSRTRAARAVEKGLVLVNGKVVEPSHEVGEFDDFVFLEEAESYVSMGGYKLAKALSEFGFDISGKVFADVGASTGGFTDCLFKHGAKKVYCIDVGENQLAGELKDKNIVILDNVNARNLSKDMFSEPLDGVVIDVSFISLVHILGKAAEIIGDGKAVIALIKPQFECDGRKVGKNGIVRDLSARKRIVEKIYDFALSVGLAPQKIAVAPEYKNKNTEYLMLFIKGGSPADLKKINIYANL